MFLDTSGLLSLLSPRELHHALAVSAYRQITPSVTHNLILAEIIALAQARSVPRTAVLQMLEDLSQAPRTQVVWVDAALHQRAIELLRTRPDKSYSLADAVSFVVMRDRGILDALTNDRHFEQEGFRRLLVS